MGLPVLELRGERLMDPPLRRAKKQTTAAGTRFVVRRYDWWPCFICGVECRCPHREPELIEWFEGRAK